MWWCDRRTLLAALLALPACGFAPAYGPGHGAGRLIRQVALAPARTEAAFAFNARIEDRLGRASSSAPYLLEADITIADQGLGVTSTGATTRLRLVGTVDFALRAAPDPDAPPLVEGAETAFAGYSTTGNAVATLAAEGDARDRVMVLLADQVIDRLLLDLPAVAP